MVFWPTGAGYCNQTSNNHIREREHDSSPSYQPIHSNKDNALMSQYPKGYWLNGFPQLIQLVAKAHVVWHCIATAHWGSEDSTTSQSREYIGSRFHSDPTVIRQPVLQASWGGFCQCPVCTPWMGCSVAKGCLQKLSINSLQKMENPTVTGGVLNSTQQGR